MPTALLTHSDCRLHRPPEGHPERHQRLEAVEAALGAPEFAALLRVEAPLAGEEDIRLAHPPDYLAMLRRVAPAGPGLVQLDPDTWMSAGTLPAALRAAGGAVKAVDLVMAGAARNAFVACRPPGHHAERATAMGFCLFGTVVIAARHALERHGLSRVAIVDFDVHHGNGTQDLVWDDPRIFYASTHQMPLYPGTGHPSERGAHGQVLNVPLAPGTGGEGFREKVEGLVLPALEAFAPEFLVVSAGFDAHARDPLAGLRLAEADFAWVTDRLCALAARRCGGRLVSSLEGGYDLAALGASVAAHVKVLMEHAA